MEKLTLMTDKFLQFDFSKIKLCIVFGGNFEESEVSKMSASSILQNLNKFDFAKIDSIEYSDNLIENLKKSNPDIVFNAMHGEFGEDGRLPALLDFLKIKYTNSGYLTSIVAMQKNLANKIFQENGIPIASNLLISKNVLNDENINSFFKKLNTDKIVIKPVDGGSSIGVSILEKNQNYNISESLKSKSKNFLVEEFVGGVEVAVPVILGTALGILQLNPKKGFYDYENKYTDGKTDHIYPARLPDEIYKKVLKYAEIAHEKLGCKTLSRSDFKIDLQKNQIIILEVNTHPGMTKLSIFPEVAAKNGISFEKLLKLMIYDAYCE